MTIWLHRAVVVLAFVGLFVAGYLTLSHTLGKQIPCGPSGGCNVVAQHPTSRWLRIPVAVYGLAGYLTVLGLALLRAFKGSKNLLLAFGITAVGMAASLFLQYQSLFIIRALCEWCMASAGIMTVLFLVHAALYQRESSQSNALPKDLTLIGICTMLVIGGLGAGVGQLNRAAILPPLKGEVMKTVTPADLVGGEEFMMGPKDAKVVVVEFADYYCGSCRDNYAGVKQVLQTYGDRIRFGFANFPIYNLKGHEMSVQASAASLYAHEKGRYFEFIDQMFTRNVDDLRSAQGIQSVLADIGLDAAEFTRRIADDKLNAKWVDKITDVQAKASKAGVDMTPTFIIFAEGLAPKVLGSGLDRELTKPEYQKLLRPNGS